MPQTNLTDDYQLRKKQKIKTEPGDSFLLEMSYTSSPTTLQLNGGGEGKRSVMKGFSETMKRYLKWINRTNAPRPRVF